MARNYDKKPVLICVGKNPNLRAIVAQAALQGIDAKHIGNIGELYALLRTHADNGGAVAIGVSDESFACDSEQADLEQQVVDVSMREGFVVGLVDTSPTRLMQQEIPYLFDPRRRRAVRLAAIFVDLDSFKSSGFRERISNLYPRVAGPNVRIAYKIDEAESVHLMGYFRQLIHQTQNV